jgi:hypothetical protein
MVRDRSQKLNKIVTFLDRNILVNSGILDLGLIQGSTAVSANTRKSSSPVTFTAGSFLSKRAFLTVILDYKTKVQFTKPNRRIT